MPVYIVFNRTKFFLKEKRPKRKGKEREKEVIVIQPEEKQIKQCVSLKDGWYLTRKGEK